MVSKGGYIGFWVCSWFWVEVHHVLDEGGDFRGDGRRVIRKNRRRG